MDKDNDEKGGPFEKQTEDKPPSLSAEKDEDKDNKDVAEEARDKVEELDGARLETLKQEDDQTNTDKEKTETLNKPEEKKDEEVPTV